MNRTASLVSLCLTLLVAALSCICACDDDPLKLTHDDREVVVPDRYRACSADDDCILVGISCDGCCERDAVTKALEQEFDRDRKDSCAGYSGAECSCTFAEVQARCEDTRCVAVDIPAD